MSTNDLPKFLVVEKTPRVNKSCYGLLSFRGRRMLFSISTCFLLFRFENLDDEDDLMSKFCIRFTYVRFCIMLSDGAQI